MKKMYQLLDLKLVRFDEDVITTSGNTSSEPMVDVSKCWGSIDSPVNEGEY